MAAAGLTRWPQPALSGLRVASVIRPFLVSGRFVVEDVGRGVRPVPFYGMEGRAGKDCPRFAALHDHAFASRSREGNSSASKRFSGRQPLVRRKATR